MNSRLVTAVGFLVTLTLAVPLHADRIYLKQGDYFDVDSWREEGGMIYYERFGGTIAVPKDEVLKIEKSASDPTKWQAPASPSSSGDLAVSQFVSDLTRCRPKYPKVGDPAAQIFMWVACTKFPFEVHRTATMSGETVQYIVGPSCCHWYFYATNRIVTMIQE